MALYKDDTSLEQTDDAVFDVEHQPGETAAYSGIYGCVGCGREVVCADGKPLPSREDHEHSPSEGDFRWRLLVNADAEPKSDVDWTHKSIYRRCGHPACNCAAPSEGKFCSEYCHDAGRTLELSCNCGHAGCAAGFAHRS